MLERIPANRPTSIFAARPLFTSLAAAIAPLWPAPAQAAERITLRLVRADKRPASLPNIIALDWSQQSRWPHTAALGETLRHVHQQRERLRKLAAAGMAVPPTDDSALLELGRAVAALLPAGTRAALQSIIQRAPRRALHIQLEADPDALAALAIPWELLVLPIGLGADGARANDDFVLLHSNISLARQVAGWGCTPSAPLARPLSIQAFAAAPSDARPINVATARDAYIASSDHWYAGPATLAAIHARMRSSHPQVVQLLCHGEISDNGIGQRCHLLLTHGDGRAQRVAPHDLARTLMTSRQIQLVLLQTCHSGTLAGGADVAASNAALTLLRYGVPAVVAMQGEVKEAAAHEFMRVCLAALADGSTSAQAVAAGRGAMYVAGHADWMLPVLYTGSAPGRSYTLASPGRRWPAARGNQGA